MTIYYAHTGVVKYNIPAQTYDRHILNMFKKATVDSHILSPMLRKATLLAVLFHDFGKLDSDSQKILCLPDQVKDIKMINHVDAGVSWLIKEYNKTSDISYVYAAYLVHAHHIGLQNRDSLFELKIDKRMNQIIDVKDLFRDNKFNSIVNLTVKEHFDTTMDSLYAIQYSILKNEIDSTQILKFPNSAVSSMDLRFALSVLVDADHEDTSQHYGLPVFVDYDLRASDRLVKLNKEVSKVQTAAKKKGIKQEVIDSRSVLFNECSKVNLSNDSFFVCDAPTGKGKTFSLMNLALRLAAEKELKRVFFIIPFTNIISQSVKNYRKYTVLKNEDPIEVINEIHSKVEFQDWRLRKYSHLWSAPINISTSVQFFESLFSNRPSAIRKLKNFANSVIVFDEYHTSLPQHLWKVALYALKDISKKFNINFVFGSGTHVHYWDIFSDVNLLVKDVVSEKTFNDFKKFELERISFADIGVMNDDMHFYNQFDKIAVSNGKLIGSTIIVCNTVANAVYMTKYFNDTTNWKIFHMSSYLTPVDREAILKKIHASLKKKEKILLVATSVAECGLDFSFEVGFREYGAMMSTIQFGGRVNRNKEKTQAFVYEFKFSPQFLQSGTFSKHPGLVHSVIARNGVTVEADNCTMVITNEIQLKNKANLVANETLFNFSTMKNDFEVIPNLTVSVIINKDIINKIKNGDKVTPVQISRNSISVYRTKIDPIKGKWASFVETITNNGDDVLFWVGSYDKNMYGAYACEL